MSPWWPRRIQILAAIGLGAMAALAYAAPANDNFSAATTLTVPTSSATLGSASLTSVGASIEAGEPCPNAPAGTQRSVWWKFTAPATGYFVLYGSVPAHNIVTTMNLYQGASVNALTLKTWLTRDYTGPGSSERVEWAVTAGATYALQFCSVTEVTETLSYFINTNPQSDLYVIIYQGPEGQFGFGTPYGSPDAAINHHVVAQVYSDRDLFIAPSPGSAGRCKVVSGTGQGGSVTTVDCLQDSPFTGAPGMGGTSGFYAVGDFPDQYVRITATVSSSTPDPNPANNTASLVLGTPMGNDVPALPWWGMLLLAGVVGAALLRAQSLRNATEPA